MNALEKIAKKAQEKLKNSFSLNKKSLHNFNTGTLNDYLYRPGQFGAIMGEICYNNLVFDEIVYEKFICPMVDFIFFVFNFKKYLI
jgi:hypothetical protein